MSTFTKSVVATFALLTALVVGALCSSKILAAPRGCWKKVVAGVKALFARKGEKTASGDTKQEG